MKKIRELFQNTKLNIKFTSIIILFMVIPIGVLAGVLFYVMEQNAVQENMDYMEYTMQRNEDGIKTKIDSINMSTQFFLSDDSLLQMLNASAIGGEISTADWLDFKNNEVSALERLVNNNPLLYGVRVYAVNDSVQEMMPILYNASRMKKQEWSKQDKYVGWNFDYTDNIFNSYTMNQNRKIISLVTPIIDSANGKVGVIESAMTMENMFPSLYEGIEDEWSFFYSDEGVTYFGQKEQTESSALLDDILKQRPTEDKIQTIYKKLDGKNLVISYMQVRELSGTLICVKDITKNVHNVYFMRDVFVAVMLAFIILRAFFINRIVQHLLKQFPVENNEIVLEKDITFYSMCEHHLMPFYGKAHVAYIPDGKVVGLSKLARTVEVYARRLQIQERMTAQIADDIMKYLAPQGVMVMLEAEHMCMTMRGIKKPGSQTITMVTRGVFAENKELQDRFLQLVNR